MLPRVFLIFSLVFAHLIILGCSTSDSQERLTTVLCWLRPSCLPSQPKGYKPPPSGPSVSKLPRRPLKPVKTPILNGPSTPCLTSAKIKVNSSKPFVNISYIEPTTKANEQALTNLAKTTIYHDVGKGLVKYKDIPATNPQGGGTVQEKVSFTISKGTSIQATICVTATNANGQEG